MSPGVLSKPAHLFQRSLLGSPPSPNKKKKKKNNNNNNNNMTNRLLVL